MKKKIFSLFLAFIFLASVNVIAQDNQTSEYDKQKLNTPYVPDKAPKTPVNPNSSQSLPFIAQNNSDSTGVLLEPLDPTFLVAPFAGATPPEYRNDDLSTGLITFPTGCEFCLYGTIYTGCYINNNGNITFTGPFGTFTPTGFPIGTAMVAPFWGDVDTRLGGAPPTSGLVYYKFTTGTGTGLGWRMTVIWDKVGYFAVHNDKQNEFEVIISNGLDPLVGIGNNVCFSYVNMAWTTGDASGGIGGFGGAPATIGVNKGGGSGIFSTLGRFNRPGSYYGGPGVDTNGVSYLDKLTLCFAVCDASNFCPVPGGFPSNDTVSILGGSLYSHSFNFSAPELGQTVTSSVSGAPAGFTYVITDGTLSTIDVSWTPSCPSQAGYHTVCFTGIDNFTPPCTTTVCVVFEVDCPGPVEMSAFFSSVNNRDVTLNWTTSAESNNSGFDIERSTLSNEWTKIGNVSGHGTVSTPQSYTFTDRNLTSGTYNYRLKQIDYNGNFEYFNLSNEVVIGTPTTYSLKQNYPNPFNPTTRIEYALPYDGKVSLTIFDNSGKEVAKLINGNQTAGFHTVNFDGSKLASGVYYYRIEVSGQNNFIDTRKMLLVK